MTTSSSYKALLWLSMFFVNTMQNKTRGLSWNKLNVDNDDNSGPTKNKLDQMKVQEKSRARQLAMLSSSI